MSRVYSFDEISRMRYEQAHICDFCGHLIHLCSCEAEEAKIAPSAPRNEAKKKGGDDDN
jgi:hypothetical protein